MRYKNNLSFVVINKVAKVIWFWKCWKSSWLVRRMLRRPQLLTWSSAPKNVMSKRQGYNAMSSEEEEFLPIFSRLLWETSIRLLRYVSLSTCQSQATVSSPSSSGLNRCASTATTPWKRCKTQTLKDLEKCSKEWVHTGIRCPPKTRDSSSTFV